MTLIRIRRKLLQVCNMCNLFIYFRKKEFKHVTLFFSYAMYGGLFKSCYIKIAPKEEEEEREHKIIKLLFLKK